MADTLPIFTKQLYRPSEVAEILKVNTTTLHWWEKVFPMFKPNRTPKGTRRYTHDNIKMAWLINELLHKKGMKTDAAIKYIAKTYRKHPPRNPFKCENPANALSLLQDAKLSVEDAHACARIDAVINWLQTL